MSALYARCAAALLLIVTLFGAGWYAHSAFDAKREVKVLQADKKETAQSIEGAVKSSIKVDADIEADHDHIDAIRDKVTERLSKPTYAAIHHDPVHDLRSDPTASANLAEPDPVCAVPVLDAGTVRLLNAARQGAELLAAGGHDGEIPPATRPPN